MRFGICIKKWWTSHGSLVKLQLDKEQFWLGWQEISTWQSVKVANWQRYTLCWSRSSDWLMNNHSVVALPWMCYNHWIIVFFLAGSKSGTSCCMGSLYLLFQDILRDGRNTNNGWKDIGFIVVILHQEYISWPWMLESETVNLRG